MLSNRVLTSTKQRGKNAQSILSLALLILGAVAFLACESAVQEGGSLAQNISRQAASVRQAIPIGSAADLALIGIDIDYPADGEYVLTASFPLPSTWTPICSPSNAFTGTFDGNGHTITVTGFNDDALAGTDPIGIFSQVGSGLAGNSIHDLDVVLSDTLSITTPARFVGGVAGRALGANGALVSFNEISVTGTLAAEFTGTNQPYPAENGFQVGGVVGRADYANIENCRSETDVTVNANYEHGAYNTSAGCIAGYVLNTQIKTSSSSGAVSLSALATLPTTWDNAWEVYAGNLVGYQGKASSIYQSSAAGNVSVTAPFPYAGGLVGYNYGYNDFIVDPNQGSSIKECYATGTVRADTQVGSNGISYAGGLAAYSSIIPSIIENSYATGSVTSVSDSQYAWAGGLIGGNAYNSVVSKCYATGTVTVTNGSGTPLYPPNFIKAGAAAGGIAGYNYYTPATTVEYCAALNNRITGNGTSLLLHRVAGDLGVNDPTIDPNDHIGTLNRNIANGAMTISPATTINPGYNTVDGADIRLPVQQPTFEIDLGWDFDSIWEMGSSDLPVLQWQ